MHYANSKLMGEHALGDSTKRVEVPNLGDLLVREFGGDVRDTVCGVPNTEPTPRNAVADVLFLRALVEMVHIAATRFIAAMIQLLRPVAVLDEPGNAMGASGVLDAGHFESAVTRVSIVRGNAPSPKKTPVRIPSGLEFQLIC